LEDALAYGQGERSRGFTHEVEVPEVDVRVVRARLGLSQAGLAAMFRVSVAAVRNGRFERADDADEGRRLLEQVSSSLSSSLVSRPDILLALPFFQYPALVP
jgi:ribosome-binding protein aMBF1 (putative translation factor)